MVMVPGVGNKHHSMRGLFMNKHFPFLLLLVVLFPLNGCAGLKQGPVDTALKIKRKEEILVARDIGKGSSTYHPKWCGNNALLFKGENIGVELIDFMTKKRLQISTGEDEWPLNCSPDGRWVVYMKNTFRPAPQKDNADEIQSQKESPGTERVAELFLYEVRTGIRYKFAESEDIGSFLLDVVSPDGSKVFLGARHNYDSEVPGASWEAVWFSNDEWSAGSNTLWFPDSSGMVTFTNHPFGIGVEFFGNEGWAKVFKLGPEYGEVFSTLNVDTENRIYFVTENDLIPRPDINSILYRCIIKDKELSCEKIFESEEYGPYEILPGGDIIFEAIYDKCIRRITPGQSRAECVIDKRYGSRTYHDISFLGISTDKRWLAFKRSNGFQSDLFAIELIYD
jgi:hypothetical protein